ncbi:hypothetical protein O181_088821 [Austropuccinia psidii MF-1]|uniref:Uncharacterized protein n=1 Tax=Austropuccinia psidii MF-1 TaxID=1389203 RepID=A0A9Q3ISD8_9BASI|nr:hypothetical protein [Austropuccinia psidii MF-1]
MFVCCPPLLTTQPEEFSPKMPLQDDETISEHKWTLGPQEGRWERFWMISPVPSSIDLSTPLLGHHLMVTSLLDLSEVIIRPMKDGNGERTFELGLIITMSCHQWDSNAKQPTPGPSGTLLSDKFFREPPIPGPSPSSQPPEDVMTCEPEPEVAPTQSMEELFVPPRTPTPPLLVQSPSHSHDDARQEFTDLRPALMIPQAIIHESIS